MIHSVCATIDPLLAATFMAIYGPSSSFRFEAVVAVAYALFVPFRVVRVSRLPAAGRARSVALPDISAEAMKLDPRTEPHR